MRRLLALLLSLAACHPAGSASAPVAGAACGGGSSEPAPWCTEPFPGPDPSVLPAARLALIDALAAACPPATADDPAPGLSPGARSIDAAPRRRGVFFAPIEAEIDALERLLAATAESSPDHVLLLDRLALDCFELELASHTACRQTLVPEVATRSALRVEEGRVQKIVKQLRRGREGAARQCAALARLYPQYTQRAPCDR
jgi:hypothetical protein